MGHQIRRRALGSRVQTDRISGHGPRVGDEAMRSDVAEQGRYILFGDTTCHQVLPDLRLPGKRDKHVALP